MLVEDRIAAQRRIEDPDAEPALDDHEQQRDADDRGREDLDPCRGIQRPDEQRHPEPGHPRRAHPVDRGDEIQPGQDRREPEDERREQGGEHIRRRADAVRDVERPSRIRGAARQEHRDQRQQSAGQEEPPGEQIQPREEDVLRPDQQREHEVAEDRRQPGMMNRKIIMMPCSVKNVLYVCGSTMVFPGVSISRRIRTPKTTAMGKKTHHGHQIQQPDALVVRAEDPGRDDRCARSGVVEVGSPRPCNSDGLRHALSSLRSGALPGRRDEGPPRTRLRGRGPRSGDPRDVQRVGPSFRVVAEAELQDLRDGGPVGLPSEASIRAIFTSNGRNWMPFMYRVTFPSGESDDQGSGVDPLPFCFSK